MIKQIPEVENPSLLCYNANDNGKGGWVGVQRAKSAKS